MISLALFLMAIAAVETGNNPKAIGAAGERSAYQMTEATWRRYSSDPFQWATERPEEARRVALEHAGRLLKHVRPQSGPRAVFRMARQWNPNASAEYARRVAASYVRLEREHPASALPNR